jgi:hypothetical protein
VIIQAHLKERITSFGEMINDMQSFDVVHQVRKERIANNNLFKPLK